MSDATPGATQGFWDRFDEQLQEATKAALGYMSEKADPVETVSLPTRAAHLDVLYNLEHVARDILHYHRRPARIANVLSVTRVAALRQTIIQVRLTCGHTGRFRLDEESLWRPNTREMIDYILDRLLYDEPERRCYCVHKETL